MACIQAHFLKHVLFDDMNGNGTRYKKFYLIIVYRKTELIVWQLTKTTQLVSWSMLCYFTHNVYSYWFNILSFITFQSTSITLQSMPDLIDYGHSLASRNARESDSVFVSFFFHGFT